MARGIRCAPQPPRTSAWLVIATLLSALVAGCLESDPAPASATEDQDAAADAGGKTADDNAAPAPEPGPGSAPPTTPSPSAENATVEPVFVSRKAVEIAWSGCREYTTRIATTAGAFADQLPEGFAVVASDPAGATTDIVVWYRFCEKADLINAGPRIATDAEHHAEMWSAIPVTAPNGLVATSADHDYWPITWTVDSVDVLDNYFAWGLSGFARPGTADITRDADGGAAFVDGVGMEHDGGRYRFALNIALTGNGPAPDTARVWVPGGQAPLGAVWIERSNGTNGGEGAGYVRQSGDDSFATVMPVTGAGYLESVDVTTRFEAAL